MQRINLYQEQFRPRRDPTDAAHLGMWLLLAVLVLAGVTVLIQWRADAAEQRLAEAEQARTRAAQRLETLRDRLDEVRARAEAPEHRLAALRAELRAKQRLLEYLASGPLARRDGFSPYLRGLARHTVDGAWLERIVLANGGNRLRLDGHATGPQAVPALVAALGKAGAYQGHQFRTLRMQRAADANGRIEFVLASEPVEQDRSARRGNR